MTRKEFLKLTVRKQREILKRQCTPEIVRHYEVTCPDCGLYYPGHATGALDICACPDDRTMSILAQRDKNRAKHGR